MIRTVLLGAFTSLLVISAGAEAQDRRGRSIPNGHLPPPGECRVWQRGVPPGHQAPPTNCREARREARYNGGRVVRGGRDGRNEHRGYYNRDRRDGYRNSNRRNGYSDRGRYGRCDEKDRRKGEC